MTSRSHPGLTTLGVGVGATITYPDPIRPVPVNPGYSVFLKRFVKAFYTKEWEFFLSVLQSSSTFPFVNWVVDDLRKVLGP